MMARKGDLWKVGVILLAVALWGQGSTGTDTALACEGPAIEAGAAALHTGNMLSACRRELAQAHVLAGEAAALLEIADDNLGQLFQRCGPIPPRSRIRHAMGQLQ